MKRMPDLARHFRRRVGLALYKSCRSFLDKVRKIACCLIVLSKRSEWQLLKAKSPMDKVAGCPEYLPWPHSVRMCGTGSLGRGGLIGDLQQMDRGTIPLITKGELRRRVPVWEHAVYKAPCQANCPTGIPVQETVAPHSQRSHVDEAISMGLKVYAVSGHGVWISLSQPLHGLLHQEPCNT